MESMFLVDTSELFFFPFSKYRVTGSVVGLEPGPGESVMTSLALRKHVV